MEELPVCDNWTLLDKYSEENLKIADTMTKEELMKTTKCLMPCTFMEYRVSQFMKHFYSLFLWYFNRRLRHIWILLGRLMEAWL